MTAITRELLDTKNTQIIDWIDLLLKANVLLNHGSWLRKFALWHFNGSPKDWFTIGEHSDCLSSSIMFRFSQTESKLYPLFKQGEIFLSVLLDDNDRYWNTYRFVFSRFLREHTSLRERFCELIIARRDAWARSDFLGCHLVDADDDVTFRAAVVVVVVVGVAVVAVVADVGDKEIYKCT